MKDKKSYEIEHRIVLPNGKQRIVHEKCDTVFDDKGKPLSSTGTVQDITKLKKTEQEKEKLTNELQRRVNELERFQKITVGRELRMIELKKKIKELEKQKTR